MALPKKALGLLFLFVTASAWIGASFITQALVAPGSDKPPELEPWLLTLICSSTFMIYLPIGYYARKRKAADNLTDAAKAAEEDEGESDPMLSRAAFNQDSKARTAGGEPVGDVERQPLLHGPLQAQRASQHGTLGDGDDSTDGHDRPANTGSGGGKQCAGEGVGTRQIARAALMVAPVWFAAQLAFTASLEFTSVTSNTVLSSCSSLFVYLGSLALGQEVGSSLRLASVVAAMAGTTLVALGDSRSKGGNEGSGGTGGGTAPLFGDALTLVAAALYAAYTLIMKRMLVKDDGAVMALFFGCIGALCFAVLVPLAAGLALAGSGVVTRVTAQALGLALVQGLVDYVAADYAWARAVMLLGPTATSCGLAMQIPAAAIVDSLVNGNSLAWSETPASLFQFAFGSLLIIAGFIGVSLDARMLEAAFKRVWGKQRGAAPGTGSRAAWRGGNDPSETEKGGDGAGRVHASRSAGLLQRGPAGTSQTGSGVGGTRGDKRSSAGVLGVDGTRLGINGEVTYIPLGDTPAANGASGRQGS